MTADLQTDWKKEVVVVHSPAMERAKQDLDAYFGVNEVSAGSRAISMLVTKLGPGQCSNAHYHVDSETAIYGVSGSIRMFYGERLEHTVVVAQGDFVYIPPFCPHKSYNRSHQTDAVFVTARNDPLEQERVVVVAEIDDGSCDSLVDYVD
jgi:uncharacterized RmlC-like cupin family protein